MFHDVFRPTFEQWFENTRGRVVAQFAQAHGTYMVPEVELAWQAFCAAMATNPLQVMWPVVGAADELTKAWETEQTSSFTKRELNAGQKLRDAVAAFRLWPACKVIGWDTSDKRSVTKIVLQTHAGMEGLESTARVEVEGTDVGQMETLARALLVALTGDK